MVTEKQYENTNKETKSVIREFCGILPSSFPDYTLTGRPKLSRGRFLNGIISLAVVPNGCFTPAVVGEFHYADGGRVEIQYDRQHQQVAEKLAEVVTKYKLPLFMGPFGQPPEPGSSVVGGLEKRCAEEPMGKLIHFPVLTPEQLRPAVGYI